MAPRSLLPIAARIQTRAQLVNLHARLARRDRPLALAHCAATERSDMTARVSSRLSRSSALISTAAGLPLRVTTMRSCWRWTRSTSSEKRAFTAASDNVSDMTRILVMNVSDFKWPLECRIGLGRAATARRALVLSGSRALATTSRSASGRVVESGTRNSAHPCSVVARRAVSIEGSKPFDAAGRAWEGRARSSWLRIGGCS